MKLVNSRLQIFLGLTLLALLTSPEAAFALEVLPQNTENHQGLKDFNVATGDVHLKHVPGLVAYWIQILLQLAGSFAVIMIMVGAVQYMIGSVSNDKEQGKKTLIYALTGLVVAFFAWWIVELLMVWMTS